MANYEAKVRTKAGEITIHFDNKEDLEKKLEQVNEFIDAINKSGVVIPETKVDTGLEKIYNLRPDGLPRLLKVPKSKSDTIRLLLFVSPDPLDFKTITKLTGVKRPQDSMNSDHFVKMSRGKYTLNPEGKRRVSDIIIPQLLSKGENENA